MPEGDSVYRLARRLDAGLSMRRVQHAELRVPRHATADLSGRQLVAHETHGKHLLTRFDDGLVLHTHMRMSGSWSVLRAGRRLPRRLDHQVRVLLEMTGGPTAYGLDLPVVELVSASEIRSVLAHLGPDPLRPDWDEQEARHRLDGRPETPVARALLDQTLIAGLGNLWANELCFLRGLNPWTKLGDVDVPRLVALAARALRISATVPGMYQVTTGSTARGERHWVAGRAGRPCLRCGTVVLVRSASGTDRRTWWCPHCQPGTEPRE